MSADLNKASNVFLLYWNDIVVGFCAVLPIPSGNVKYSYRAHRLVILPDYQGLGIGTQFLNFIAQYYIDRGLKFNIRCTHTKMRHYLERSSLWTPTSHNNKKSDPNSTIKPSNEAQLYRRVCGAFEYIGSKAKDLPHIDMFLEYTEDFDLELFKADLEALNDRYYITVMVGNVNDPNPIEDICKELGVRTQLLYYRGKLISKYQKKKIISVYDKAFSDKVKKYYKI